MNAKAQPGYLYVCIKNKHNINQNIKMYEDLLDWMSPPIFCKILA